MNNSFICSERCHVEPQHLRIDAIPSMAASIRAATTNLLYPRHGFICARCGEDFKSLAICELFLVSAA